MRKKVYVAGPMRGIRDFNFPAFHKAADLLRGQGYSVFNPAESDEKNYGPEIFKSATGSNDDLKDTKFCLREAMRIDTQFITLFADVIALLPGWSKSSGARAEYALASALRLETIFMEGAEMPPELQTTVNAVVSCKHNTLPQDAAARKTYPIATGVLDYFPDAIAEISHLSWKGNEQHNPGEALHWERDKSADHVDCLARHLFQRGTVDTDGLRHSAKLAWRALALLQIELETKG